MMASRPRIKKLDAEKYYSHAMAIAKMFHEEIGSIETPNHWIAPNYRDRDTGYYVIRDGVSVSPQRKAVSFALQVTIRDTDGEPALRVSLPVRLLFNRTADNGNVVVVWLPESGERFDLLTGSNDLGVSAHGQSICLTLADHLQRKAGELARSITAESDIQYY